MANRKLELLQLQTSKRTPCHEPKPEGLMGRYRKILVFSTDLVRLSAVVESLSNCGHKCIFARTMEEAKEHLANPEVGFIAADVHMIADDSKELLEAIEVLRPDIYGKSKMHFFTASLISELRETFSHAGEGIEPLTEEQ